MCGLPARGREGKRRMGARRALYAPLGGHQQSVAPLHRVGHMGQAGRGRARRGAGWSWQTTRGRLVAACKSCGAGWLLRVIQGVMLMHGGPNGPQIGARCCMQQRGVTGRWAAPFVGGRTCGVAKRQAAAHLCRVVM